jgi:hypothetical protein
MYASLLNMAFLKKIKNSLERTESPFHAQKKRREEIFCPASASSPPVFITYAS